MRHVEPSWTSVTASGRRALIVVTDRRHGDLAVDSAGVDARRARVVDAPWTWLRQVHGAAIVHAGAPGDQAGARADGAWTDALEAPLAVQVADCAPIGLVAAEGLIAAVHAGWRGLVAGVVERAVSALRAHGATEIVAVLGPCIGPAHYEFGPEDLDPIVDRFGPSVRACTRWGTPALDVPAAVGAALGECGVPLVSTIGSCTARDAERWWSHRARGERERQALVIWMES